jgi:hypothetical protein
MVIRRVLVLKVAQELLEFRLLRGTSPQHQQHPQRRCRGVYCAKIDCALDRSRSIPGERYPRGLIDRLPNAGCLSNSLPTGQPNAKQNKQKLQKTCTNIVHSGPSTDDPPTQLFKKWRKRCLTRGCHAVA